MRRPRYGHFRAKCSCKILYLLLSLMKLLCYSVKLGYQTGTLIKTSYFRISYYIKYHIAYYAYQVSLCFFHLLKYLNILRNVINLNRL